MVDAPVSGPTSSPADRRVDRTSRLAIGAAGKSRGAIKNERYLGAGRSQHQTATGPLDVNGLRAFMGAGFELTTAAMILIDQGQLIRCTNTAANVLFGSDDMTGRSILDFCVPVHPRPDLEAVAPFAGDLNRPERTIMIRLESGRRSRALARVDTVTPPSGELLYLVQVREVATTVTDGTARAESESHDRQLVSNLPGMSVVTFDCELRVIRAGGEVLDRGYNAAATPGKVLTDVLPPAVLAVLEGTYRATTRGQEADVDYHDPVTGRVYRIRLRPVAAADGTVVGGLSLTEDVTVERARQSLLTQMQRLGKMGCVSYDRAGGWVADAELTTLLGTEPGDDVLRALDTFVVPENRASTMAAYRDVLASGGETTLQYRLVHGKTGQLRHVVGSIRATVDGDRGLLHAIATVVDVTDAVDAHTETVKAAGVRTLLLRSVSDALAKAPRSDRDVMQSLVDVATAALGDGTVLRVFTAAGGAVETDLVSDRDDLAQKRVASCLRESARGDAPGIVDAAGEAGELWSSIRNVHWREDFQRRLGHPVGHQVQHFISAAVRHDGVVLGYLRVYRSARDRPYQVGDDDLVQVLADRIGYVIAESRVRQLLEHQRTEHRAVADRLQELTTGQRELLEQLAEVEERERTLLAEAIHDGPMQLVVAVMMRLENSGITQETIDDVELERLIVTLETSIQRLRTLIVALTPPDLSKGLGEALRKLAEGIFLGTATQITVVGQAHVNLTLLSTCNAHRILREALVNARKHAQAGHVVLELTECRGTVIARLTDDGVGATSLDAGPGHLGMATMRARAEADGGRLDVTSAPGAGTTVVLTLPTAPADHREHHRSDDVPQLASLGPLAQ